MVDRYSVRGKIDCDGDEIPPYSEKDKNGRWVKYEDVKHLLQEKNTATCKCSEGMRHIPVGGVTCANCGKEYPEAYNITVSKSRVYMVCDYADDRAASMDSAPNIGVEFMGSCRGRILKEDGTVLGGHSSSSFGWLREDLKYKLDNPDNYEIIDLIGKEIPDNLKGVFSAS